jgi:hypothetical protein
VVGAITSASATFGPLALNPPVQLQMRQRPRDGAQVQSGVCRKPFQ